MIELINSLDDVTRYAFMDAAPFLWSFLDFLIEFFTDLTLYEDGSIG